MKKLSFIPGIIIGLLCGLALSGTVLAAITANPSTHAVKINGQPVALEGYNIGGNNFYKLRDIGAAVDFGVDYDAATATVLIDTSKGYTVPADATTTQPPVTQPTTTPATVVDGIRYTKGQTIADGSGSISDTELTTKVIAGEHMSREDFSQKANPAIFNTTYTREAYNTLRQTVIDRDAIVQSVNDNAVNPYYSYASASSSEETKAEMKFVAARSGIYNRYETGVEGYRTGQLWLYPGYFICKASIPSVFDEANKATDAFVATLKAMGSDTERIKAINDYVCEHITYGKGYAGPSVAFTGTGQSVGLCGSYTECVQYLCDRVGIPCVSISGENHAWNVVYVGGKWLYVDSTANDGADELSRREACLLSASHPNQDDYPQRTQYAKEVLVPGSTK